MKLNFEKGKKPKDNNNSNVIRHIDYLERQKITEAPFGNSFKKGAYVDKKKQAQKGVQKHKGKNDW